MIRAKKSLGQHFLKSKPVLEKIGVLVREKINSKVILEIGPGEGVLTEVLIKNLENTQKIIAVEKDNRLISILREKFSREISKGILEIIEADVLTYEVYFTETYSIVANIPYYITGAIVEKFLDSQHKPEHMILMVQEEVADRIIARDRKESLLSVAVNAYAKPKKVLRVPRGAFKPVPNIDSAVLHISNISYEKFVKHGVSQQHFFDIIRTGFAGKRKQLAKKFLKFCSSKDELSLKFQSINIKENVRAEDVPVEKWFDIAEMFKITQE